MKQAQKHEKIQQVCIPFGYQKHSVCGVIVAGMLLVVTFCLFETTLSAQKPFICEDQFFQTLTDSSFSALNEVVIDPKTNRVVFKSINNKLPFPVNAAGYRSTDNFIYCINPETYDLIRIDATGQATVLKNLPLNRSFTYFAGDVSPDGKYLVLIGRRVLPTGAAVSADIAKVDLESPNYTLTLSAINTNTQILDIAFHPVSDILYGYDSNLQRLVRIDINTGVVSTPFSSIAAPYIVGALFFDAYGNLYAYGSPNASSDQNTLYEIDPLTGQASFLTSGTKASSSDGCSCPYTVRLSKSVTPATTTGCSLVEYTFTLVNSSRRVQPRLQITDALPKGFTFVSIKANPLGGTSSSKPGDSSFSLEGFDLPSGKHNITIVVQTGDVPAGVYRNQAKLFGLPESLGVTRVSDNLLTLVEDDSTDITITRLPFDTIRATRTICNGIPALALDAQPFAAQAGGSVTFIWPDGSRNATYSVSKPGIYPLKMTSGCDTATVLFTVDESAIEVSLVQDTFTIALGDSLFLESKITNLGNQTVIAWTDPQPGSLRCLRCPSTWALPVNDLTYWIRVSNESGCLDSASAEVTVRKNFDIYFPNVFTPDGEGANARFFPSGPSATTIQSLEVFSRWGEKMFENREILLNAPDDGWNGTTKGQNALPGVYVWVAQIVYLDGSTAILAGDVTLIR
jgi:gliding motility-associated-like protein/uncharacterized repeat protein (TIGR01451 family)